MLHILNNCTTHQMTTENVYFLTNDPIKQKLLSLFKQNYYGISLSEIF